MGEPAAGMSGKMNTNEELRQQLWEMAYGLLDPEAEAALHTQIKSDPAIARLYAEVRLQTDLVSNAARVEDSSLNISIGPAADVATQDHRVRSKSPSRSHSKASPRPLATGAQYQAGSSTNWLAIIGTTALLFLLGFGLWQPEFLARSVTIQNTAMNSEPREAFFTTVSVPSALNEGLTNTIEVETRSTQDQAFAADLDVRLVDAAGRETFRQKLSTNEKGRAEVLLPGAALRPGVRLQVSPAAEQAQGQRDQTQSLSTELPIAAERQRTLMLLEKPFADPGEKVGFTMVGVKEFSKETQLPPADELMVENRAGADVVQPMWTADANIGVIKGEFELPPASSTNGLTMRREAAGLKTVEQQTAGVDLLANRSAAEGNVIEKQSLPLSRGLMLRNDNAASANGTNRNNEPMRKAGESALKLARTADSQALAANLSGAANQTESGKTPALPAPAMAPAAAPVEVAPVAPPAPPLAAKGFQRGTLEDGRAQLADAKNKSQVPEVSRNVAPSKPGAVAVDKSDLPPPKADQLAANQVEAEQANSKLSALKLQAKESANFKSLASNGREPQAALSPTDIHESLGDLPVPAELARQSVIVVATKDNTVIARQELSPQELAANKRISLPPEVEGVVDLEYFRPGDSSAPIYRQQVKRAASRSLHFAIEGLKDDYAPGERVQLKVRVQDEEGRPVSAAVGVRVWEENAVQQVREPLLLADSFSRAKARSVDVDEKQSLALAGTSQFRKSAVQLNSRAADPPAVAAANAPGELAAAPAGGQLGAANALEAERKDGQRDLAKAQMASDETGFALAPVSVIVADNRAEVMNEVNRAADMTAALESQRQSSQRRIIGKVLAFSAGALLLLVGVLAVARRPVRPLVWLPAVSVALLTLVVGAVQLVSSGARQSLPHSAAAPAIEIAMSPAESQNEVPISPPSAEVTSAEIESLKRTTPAQAVAANGESNDAVVRVPAALPPAPVVAAREMKREGTTLDSPALQQTQAPAKVDKRRAVGEDKQNATDSPAVVARAFGAPAAKKSVGVQASEGNRDGGVAGDSVVNDLAGGEISLPSSLFWRPLSPSEPDGSVTIEFNMPAVASEYRLLVDAIGGGRLGGQQQLLICRERAP
ncbi:hypothetical protein ETAA8_28610 [Anatilimnocola aggregata]|uniref:Uncharacterized protein n=2 Tax=Anatilimnocola aggregata TaxID=2528021 RepID=A0A517YC00_9BACT|nr:hypothetical protein ETAA8_28610 [Anatilimnocola aggregata]